MAELKDAIKEAHPVYYVSDLKRSVAFYTETLGLAQAWAFGETITGIRVLPGFLIVLCEDAQKVRSGQTPALVFAVNDLDAVFESLSARGVAFTGPPEDRPYGRIATFSDPDGYCYDLCG
jgi:predicted enzyme related to lactoylglutathione lyase